MAKLPTPVLYKVIFQAQFKPYLRFYDNMNEAASRLEGYPDWRTDRLTVNLQDYANRCSMNFAHRALSYDQDSGDAGLAQRRIEEAFSVLPRELKVPAYTRILHRRVFLTPVPMRFEELSSIVRTRLYSTDEKLRKILPGDVYDILYRVDLRDGSRKGMISLAPVRREEMPRVFPLAKELNFNVNTVTEDIKSIYGKMPEVSVYTDVEYRTESEAIHIDEAVPFALESLGKVTKLVNDMNAYLFSTTIEG